MPIFRPVVVIHVFNHCSVYTGDKGVHICVMNSLFCSNLAFNMIK